LYHQHSSEQIWYYPVIEKNLGVRDSDVQKGKYKARKDRLQMVAAALYFVKGTHFDDGITCFKFAAKSNLARSHEYEGGKDRLREFHGWQRCFLGIVYFNEKRVM
jgi:hypothetical protein